MMSSCDTVLEVCRDGLIAVHAWLGGVRHGRIRSLVGIQRKERAERISEQIRQMKELRARISEVLESFRSNRRFQSCPAPFFCVAHRLFIIIDC